MKPLGRPVAAAVGACLVVTAGCASVDLRDRDWNALHLTTPPSPILDHAVEQGFRSCRNLLQDTVLHAVGDAPHEAWGGGATANTDLRPVSYAVVSGTGAETEHALVTVGPDASGKCFAQWRTTRVWPLACRTLQARSEWLSQYTKERELDATTSLYRSQGSAITVLLTDIGWRKCLMSAGELVYWEGGGADLDSTVHAAPEIASPRDATPN